jgi:putative ABC transport system permease protein
LARGAWLEIAAHKARSAMTCLSLAIGVAAMLFTFSQTGGVMKRYRTALELYGEGRMTISKRQGYKSQGRSAGLTYADAQELRRIFPDLYMVQPRVERYWTRVRIGAFKDDGIDVLGTTEEWSKREWVYTKRGRFLSARDVADGARVCVLVVSGGWIKKPYWARYFPERALDKYAAAHDLLGQPILLNDHVFTVVGILKLPPRDRDPRWFHSSRGEHGTVIVPITAFEGYMADRGGTLNGQIDTIEADTADARTAGPMLRRIEQALLQRHRGENDFEVKDFRQIMAGAMGELRGFIISILIIGVVAILAAGIGIMNVTLATIFARIREIGIRRSLGATRADIVWQFVAEAMALGLAGGAAGTIFGIAGISYFAPREDRMLAIGVTHVVGALAISLATGFLFALYPAYKASRFDPIEALRYE